MNEEINIESIDEFTAVLKNNLAVVVYFSTPDCNVCKVLKPKLKDVIADIYPELKFIYIDLSKAKELAAQYSIFTVPTIIIYFEGKEFKRKSRNISIDEIIEEISRPYSFLF